MAQVILDVKNLTKNFKKRVAVNNISFSISEGEIFGLIGPNGAGKTTALKMITGLIKPTEGSVSICGFNLESNFKKAIKNVGCIIEGPDMYGYMSGLNNLKYYAGLYSNINIKRIQEVARLVGLENRLKDKLSTYSLGMKQRLGIAQALLHRPKLLILDEPMNGLDPNGIKEMREFLLEIAHKEKVAIVISSHILSEMEQLCDTVAILNKGRIVELMSYELLKDEISRNDKMIIAVDYPNYAGKIVKEKFNIDVNVINNSIVVTTKEKQLTEIIKYLIEHNLSILGVHKSNKRLEDIYLELVKNKDKNSIY